MLCCSSSVKSFLTHSEAEAYVTEHTPLSTSISSSSSATQAKQFYGVARGHIPGVYTDWPTAQEQIIGWKDPKFKKFATKDQAEEFVKNGCNLKKIEAPTCSTTVEHCDSLGANHFTVDSIIAAPPSKRVKLTETQNVSLSERDTERAVVAENWKGKAVLDSARLFVQKSTVQAGVLRIHTDGSSLRNGKDGARAGLGVYFGPEDPRQVS